MKRCPTCDRTFDDESLSYCPHDGSGLVTDASAPTIELSPPAELQATMMATPSSLGGSSYAPPPPPAGPDSGSFNQPPPSQSWPNQQAPQNPSWAKPTPPQTAAPRKSGGLNTKVLLGAGGCLVLAVITILIGGVLLYAFSGPSSKMNPYKGDLKDLAPDKVEAYTRTDVDVLSDRDKKEFGKVNEALGVGYKGSSDTEISMFVGNYSSTKDAEDALKSFRDESVSKGWSASDIGSKKMGWRTVGSRFILTKDISTGKVDDKILPDGAVIVLAQAGPAKESKKIKIIAWTNGSVLFAVSGENNRAEYFETDFDKTAK